jgi:adenosylcobinamide kinase/adenosylcobinamide-phosphate guanylyltransferase
MGKITFIVGGARSGKSSYAARCAERYKRVAFIATAEALDHEMRQRIRLHKQSRPRHWKIFEEPTDIATLAERIGNTFDCLIIDCITLFVSNRILRNKSQKDIFAHINTLMRVLKKKKARTFIVSNEVGLGIVPAYKLGRTFRDIASSVNQIIAKESHDVFFTVSGIPLKIKGAK